ncbi:MAG: HDOD domain-containing protein, partial [Lacipirellulaceae bacterium]
MKTPPASHPSLERLVARAGHLYTLPSVAAELVRLTDEPTIDPTAIRRAVERDPAITAKLLRVVNYSVRGNGAGISDLGQAIALLGVRPLKLLVLGFALPDRLFDGVAGGSLRRYWTETLTRAAAARAIADLAWDRGGDEALVAGLLQGLGQLVLLQQLGSAYGELTTRLDELAADTAPTVPLVELSALELENLGFDHRTLSAGLLRSWRLPDALCDAIDLQTEPEKIAELRGDEARLPQVLRLAELLTQLVARRRLTVLNALADEGALYCGFTKRHINTLVGSLQGRVDGLAEAMRVELDHGRDYERVLVAAHARLSIVAEAASGQLIGRENDDQMCEALLAESERLRDAMRCFLETGDAALSDKIAASEAIVNPAEVAPARPRRPHHAVREGGAARLAATLVQVLKACRDDRKELTLA